MSSTTDATDWAGAGPAPRRREKTSERAMGNERRRNMAAWK
jgi:hypothetical protein